MNSISQNLEKLGIGGKEADVYLAILKFKKTSVGELAKFTGIKRTTIYHCVESLLSKELIAKLTKDDKKIYLAENPEESLANMLREKKETVSELIPDLKSLLGTGAYAPEIKIYRHQSGLRKIFEDMLFSKERTIRYYVSDLSLDALLGKKFLADFVKKRIKRGIRSLSLRSQKYKPEREQGALHSKQLREVRFIPENIEIKPYMCIYENKVVVIASRDERVGFIVESREFAEAQKNIFDLLWNSIAV
ncbi:MAG: helix-turn-helix domain-containing protein [Parcubacteria group bacterium]|jgi:sugar-specific transcriptional regulator TrmB